MDSKSRESRAIVLKFFQTFHEAGAASCMSLVADHAQWWVQGPAPAGGMFNKATIEQSFARIPDTMTELVFELPGITVDGERVAVEAVGIGKLRDGRLWRNTYHFLFIVNNNEIVEVKEYMDTAYVASMFAPN
jgi:uncharacterized protein